MVDGLEELINDSKSADIAARKEIMALKMQLELANKRTAVGYYDAFVDTSGVDTGNTTATFDSTNKLYTFTGSKVLKMGDQVFDQFKAMDLSLYPKKINKVTVSGAVSNSKTVNVSASDKTLVIGDKLFIGGAENNIDGLINNSVTYDRTNPVTAATGDLSTAGNGGRRLVRLSNGWQVFGSLDSVNGQLKIFVSKDNFATTPTQLCYYTVSNQTTGFSIVSVGNNVYLLWTNATTCQYGKFNATTVTNNPQSLWTVDSSQTATSNNSLTLGSDGNLHATWASKNATYPNQFNLRYAKGTINGDGSVTWGAVEQVSTENTTGDYNQTPCTVSALVNGNPIIFATRKVGTYYRIVAWRWTGSAWTNSGTPTPSSYTLANPSASVDSNGDCLVAWIGYDSTDTAAYNIRYSKVTSGGVTWTAPVKLTTGNTYQQYNPSIACDANNDIHVAWYGYTATNPTYINIRMIKSTSGTWGTITEVTNQNSVNISDPSLCDNYRNFEKPLMIYKEGTTAIKFYGKWTEGNGYTLTMQNAVTLASGATLPIVDLQAYQNDVAMTLKSVDSDKFNYSISGLTTTTAKVKVTGKDTQLDGLAYGVA